MRNEDGEIDPKIKESQPGGWNSLIQRLYRLRSSALPILLILLVLRGILLVGVNIALLLLAAGLPGLSALLTLATLLLIFFHVVCHRYSLIVAAHALTRAAGLSIGVCLVSCPNPGAGLITIFLPR
jgi:hypothetical protein